MEAELTRRARVGPAGAYKASQRGVGGIGRRASNVISFMSALIHVVFLASLASLLGAMVFFPAVVAPKVFTVLDEDAAGRFLRALFPAYYVFLIATSGLAALAAAPRSAIHAGVLGAVALSTLAVRQVLVPRINAARDAANAGDTAAEARFRSGHRLSVVVNMAQLIAALDILAHWSLTHAS